MTRRTSHESTVAAEIVLGVGSLPGVRVFRNNVGEGWQGRLVSHEGDLLVLSRPRRLNFGLCNGSADYVGWRELLITPAMVGEVVAQFLALEVKDKAKVADDQSRFLARVSEAGGISGDCRSVSDAIKLIKRSNI